MRATQIRNLTVTAICTLPFLGSDANAGHYRRGPLPLSHVESYTVLKVGGYGLDSLDPGQELNSGLFLGAEVGVAATRFVEVGMSFDWLHRGQSVDDRFPLDSPYDLPIEGRIDLTGSSTDLVPLGGVVRVRFPVADGTFAPFVAGQLTYDILRLQYHERLEQGNSTVLASQSDYFHGPGGTLSVGVEARLDPRFGVLFEVGTHESEPAKNLIVDGTPVRGYVVADGEFARIGMRLGFF